MLRALLYIPWKLWTLFPDSLRRRTYLYIAKNWGITHIWNVTRLPFGLALKHTHNRSPDIEANSIRFVRRNTTIPVPDVLDTVPPDGVNNSGLLLTSWIEGETLGSWNQRQLIWPDGFQKNAEIAFYSDSSEERRPALAKIEAMFPEVNVPDDHPLLVELRDALTQIRSIPSPSSGPQICNTSGGPTIWARCRDRCLLPPVNTIAEFHDSTSYFSNKSLGQAVLNGFDLLPNLSIQEIIVSHSPTLT
ncbi:hypothetical protein F5890DRAFT_1137980 [Lentinula detonsa]|uniref:Uncharacterized protein n=1 Tax=Lentinula detonsa TaxID=2804962 RepID=A0AA38Q2A2_9AGAR|nr:hypothetical protein F5890DRAFT_1137980 [Lentinula detonsa]